MLKTKLIAIKGELLYIVAEAVRDVCQDDKDSEIDFQLYYQDCADFYEQILRIETLDELDTFLSTSFAEFEERGMGLDYFIKKYY